MTLRDTLRFDLEKSSIYKRANVRPVFGAEDEDILHEVPDDTPIDFYDVPPVLPELPRKLLRGGRVAHLIEGH